MRAGAVPMTLLVGADRHFRNVGMHDAVGKNEHDVGRAATPVGPSLQFKLFEIGNEIGLPHVIAGPDQHKVSFAGIIFVLASALGKLKRGIEDEAFVMEGVHDQRQIGGRDDQCAVAAAAVEVAVLGIERDREHTARTPFEAAPGSVAEFELRAAGALQHIDHLLVEMPLRDGRAAGQDFEQEHVGEVAAALEMAGRSFDSKARPHLGLDVEEIDAIVLRDGQALLLYPF